jgi:uncharacterized damage-inducible protein DinB
MSKIGAIVSEFDDEAKRTQRVLESIPDDKMSWRPHPKSFSLGQLAMHIANIPGRISEMACNEVHQIDIKPPAEAKNRKEVLDIYAESLSTARNYLGKWDDAALATTWTGQINGQTILAIPREGLIRMIMLNHAYHHRGQLSVYLRLLNVAVPSIYGPSADENPFVAAAAAR